MVYLTAPDGCRNVHLLFRPHGIRLATERQRLCNPPAKTNPILAHSELS